MLDADTELRNWARWCNSTGDCYPSKYVTNWQLMEQVEYKNCHKSTQERLDEILGQIPIDTHSAERVELWVHQFDPLPRLALRTHYVDMPAHMQEDWRLSHDDWGLRQVRWTHKLLAEGGYDIKVDAEAYEKAVNDGVRQVQYWLNKWTVGI